MKTKYGNAKINKHGYYVITTNKENNHNKYLHRLIAEDYFGEWINEPDPNGDRWHIHHIDGDKTNNCVLNLEPIPERDHKNLHNKGRTFSEETKQKMSEAHKGENNYIYGKTLSEEHKQKISESLTGRTFSDDSMMKMSKAQNTSGYYRVIKAKNKQYKQGFIWRYQYFEDGKYKYITSIDINKLEQKVKAKGLKWRKIL